MRGARGFTLLELLVVFAIMALLIALVPAAYENMRESAQYRDVVRTMLADIRSARTQALLSGAEVSFRVDLANRVFGADGHARRPIPAAVDLRATVAGIELGSDGIASIRFLPGGGATGGTVDVSRHSSGMGTRITVDWLSGQVSQQALSP